MRILLIGGAGREHALAWKIRRSPLVTALFVAPGNAGIAEDGTCFPLPILDPPSVADWAVAEKIDLVVVGPEAPLVAGLADALEARGCAVFGPSSSAARIEGSKVFAKEFMSRHDIPTARFEAFSDVGEAGRFLRGSEAEYPLVVKADGLAAGKGVRVCSTLEEAVDAVEAAMVRKDFGAAGTRIVIEERLEGREASFFVITDGTRFISLDTCQDYKTLRDGNEGPNTGGMGGFSPSPFLDGPTRQTVLDRIVSPTLVGLSAESRPFKGALYVGLMLTSSGPRVIEYNARLGDPETQALMPRLESDLVPLLASAARGELRASTLAWRAEPSVCVVMTSEGYPGEYRRGLPISGLDAFRGRDDVIVFHAGTGRDSQGRFVTAGGRVLAVTALGRDLETARDRAYRTAGAIHFDGRHYRTDIARDISAPKAASRSL